MVRFEYFFVIPRVLHILVPSSIGQDEKFSFSKEEFDSPWDYKLIIPHMFKLVIVIFVLIYSIYRIIVQILRIKGFAYYLQKKISWAINLPTDQPLHSVMNCGAFLQMYFKCRSKLKDTIGFSTRQSEGDRAVVFH